MLDDSQRTRIAQYSDWLERTLLDTVGRALASSSPARLWAGEGQATFALNLRTNDVMAYIPSRRLWEAGGYQAGAFEVYGLPANRWCPDIEERIAGSVARLVKKVR